MPEKRNYHHGDLRSALLGIAVDLITDKGIERFSLRAAARAAGVDPSAVYRHFPDKGGLLNAVALSGFHQLIAAMEQEQATAESPTERFTALGVSYVHFSVANPALFRLMFGPHGAGSPNWAAIKEAAGHERSAFDMLVDALAALEVAEPRASAIVAWSSVHGLAALAVDSNLRAHGTEALDAHLFRIIDVVLTGLRL